MPRRLLALLFLLVVLPFRPAGAQETLVRLSFSSGWDALPSIVAIERGFFQQQGLVVSGLAVSSAGAVMRSVAVGSTDIAAVPQRTFIVMAAAKMPVTAVTMNGWGPEMELVVPKADGKTKTLADLKGKTVAMTRASEAFSVLVRLLNAAGMSPSDVKIRQIPADDLMQALQAGGADAVLESRRFTKTLAETGQARVVLSNDDIADSLGYIGAQPVVANNRMIEKQPQTVQKFVTAWARALKYIQQDPDDAADLLRIFFHRHGTKVPSSMTKDWIGMIRYDRHQWTKNAITDAEYNAWALKEGGVLKVAPKLGPYVDNRFAEKVELAMQ